MIITIEICIAQVI